MIGGPNKPDWAWFLVTSVTILAFCVASAHAVAALAVYQVWGRVSFGADTWTYQNGNTWIGLAIASITLSPLVFRGLLHPNHTGRTGLGLPLGIFIALNGVLYVFSSVVTAS